MYPPRMLYEIARTQQSEHIARAEARRRRHPASRSRFVVRGGPRLAKTPRRRLTRLGAALTIGGRH